MPRDNWNNVAYDDENAIADKVIKVLDAAKGKMTYSDMQEIRISAELCDRSHFEASVRRLADKFGVEKDLPKEMVYVLEDPDFDVRVSFMKKISDAIDPAPVQARAKRG